MIYNVVSNYWVGYENFTNDQHVISLTSGYSNIISNYQVGYENFTTDQKEDLLNILSKSSPKRKYTCK